MSEKQETIPIMVRLPKELHQALARSAEAAGRSLNKEIWMACRRWTARKG